jgi:hypothetical protein
VPGDEEPGDDEEDVDADVATGQPGHARVVQQDDADRDGAKTLDVGAEAPRAAGAHRDGGNDRDDIVCRS